MYNLCPHYSHIAMTLTPLTTRTRLSTRKSSDPSTSTQWRYGRISREALPSNRHIILIPCARSYLELLFATTLYFVNKKRVSQRSDVVALPFSSLICPAVGRVLGRGYAVLRALKASVGVGVSVGPDSLALKRFKVAVQGKKEVGET